MEAQIKESIMQANEGELLIGSLQKTLNRLFKISHLNQQMNLKVLYDTCIKEEFSELQAEDYDTPEDMKELCDLIWVCIQYANACGYDLEAGFKELIAEYTSKFYDAHGNYNPTFRADGKLLKGAGFKKANFNKFFKE